ncbi:unnamed protein product [Microthlaspi erraticum]|uniref:Uncharacterized protein n=1 Tax=Microthlaspi erraticum TaxID=1685480 RepID=A0A6D2JXQ9_9BRAS|nr:unnamed protein product [Microthlaspi erraticum]
MFLIASMECGEVGIAALALELLLPSLICFFGGCMNGFFFFFILSFPFVFAIVYLGLEKFWADGRWNSSRSSDLVGQIQLWPRDFGRGRSYVSRIDRHGRSFGAFWSIWDKGAWRDLAHGSSSTGYAKEEGRSHLEDQLDRPLDQPVEFLNSTGQASTRSSWSQKETNGAPNLFHKIRIFTPKDSELKGDQSIEEKLERTMKLFPKALVFKDDVRDDYGATTPPQESTTPENGEAKGILCPSATLHHD